MLQLVVRRYGMTFSFVPLFSRWLRAFPFAYMFLSKLLHEVPFLVFILTLAL